MARHASVFPPNRRPPLNRARGRVRAGPSRRGQGAWPRNYRRRGSVARMPHWNRRRATCGTPWHGQVRLRAEI